jgi:hypothetical protein
MHSLSDIRMDVECAGGELQAACELMIRELVEGVRHGFFEMNIRVEITQSKKKHNYRGRKEPFVCSLKVICVALAFHEIGISAIGTQRSGSIKVQLSV